MTNSPQRQAYNTRGKKSRPFLPVQGIEPSHQTQSTSRMFSPLRNSLIIIIISSYITWKDIFNFKIKYNFLIMFISIQYYYTDKPYPVNWSNHLDLNRVLYSNLWKNLSWSDGSDTGRRKCIVDTFEVKPKPKFILADRRDLEMQSNM